MKFFSKASEYAILALMAAIEQGVLDRFSPKQLCKRSGFPEPFVRKALVELSKAGILKGVPGPGGGYSLGKDPADVSLLDIVLAVDGPTFCSECPLGVDFDTAALDDDLWKCQTCSAINPNCGYRGICPLKSLWRQAKQLVVGHLARTTLADIVAEADANRSVRTAAARNAAS